MKTILITGSSSGIGQACAEKLISDNIRLILCSRNISRLHKLKNKLQSKNNEILIYEVDVQKKKVVDEMFNDLEKKQIKIDILINSAGLALDLTDIENGDTKDWDIMIDTNIKGLLFVTRRAVQQMVRNDSGHIINIGSVAGVYAYPKGAVYAATKSAVKFISDGLRKELVDKNIKVTNVQPGLVETNFSNIRFKGNRERAKRVYNGIKPLTAGDVADIIVFIANRPNQVQICEITVTPLHQASVDVIYRESKL